MKNYRVLFFCRKKDFHSEELIKFLKSKIKFVKVIFSNNHKDKLKLSSIPKKIDYIFCFRSFYILNNNILNKAKFSINFHPGPPEFRGIGCVNFAILKNSSFYGITSHLMTDKIDNGKIIDVRRFKINQKIGIEKVLSKSYNMQVKQFKFVVKSILNDEKNLQKMIKKNYKIKWSKKITNRKNLDELYKIELPKNIKNLIRATYTEKFKPFFEINGVKYEVQKKK